MSNNIKSILIKDTSTEYKQGTTVVNVNRVIKMYPKAYYRAPDHPHKEGETIGYFSIIIVDTTGEKTECFRNCRDKNQIDEMIIQFAFFLEESYGGDGDEDCSPDLIFNIPVFAPLNDYDIHGTKGSK